MNLTIDLSLRLSLVKANRVFAVCFDGASIIFYFFVSIFADSDCLF
jgi:hypothetical protein